MQMLLGVSVCALLLTFQSNVVGSATDDDLWVDTLFDSNAFDAQHFVDGGGTANVQPGPSVSRTRDACPDAQSVAQHDWEYDNVNLNFEIPPADHPALIHHAGPRHTLSKAVPVGPRNPLPIFLWEPDLWH